MLILTSVINCLNECKMDWTPFINFWSRIRNSIRNPCPSCVWGALTIERQMCWWLSSLGCGVIVKLSRHLEHGLIVEGDPKIPSHGRKMPQRHHGRFYRRGWVVKLFSYRELSIFIYPGYWVVNSFSLINEWDIFHGLLQVWMGCETIKSFEMRVNSRRDSKNTISWTGVVE